MLITSTRPISSTTANSAPPMCSPHSTMPKARMSVSSSPPNTRAAPFQAYGNIAVARQIATDPVSNQFLFDNATPLPTLGGLTEFQYLQTHWVYTDHSQWVTASAGGAYQFCGRPARPNEWMSASEADACGIRLSGNMIYGSGLRD